jgi:hypothetical protein
VAEFRRVLPTVEAGLRESLSPADLASVVERIREVTERWEVSGTAVG